MEPEIMKTIRLVLMTTCAIALGNLNFAQVKERQTGDTLYYPSLIPEEKQGLLRNMSMIANMRFAERNEFADNMYEGSRFVNEQFRLEFRGQAHRKVYFRFRDRYTRSQEPQSIDNISRSTDLAYIRIDATEKWNITLGKMCANWGAYEFDYNPIDIYEYSDIIEYADNFLTGARLAYKANDRHKFSADVLDSRTSTFDELYGSPPGKVEADAPLAFVANWTGSLFGGKFNTIWSYAFHTEAEGTFMNYVALGNQIRLGKFTLEYDWKWSQEELDRTGVISNDIPDSLYPWAVENTLYIGHWLHLYYRVSPKINLALIGMVDIAYWQDDLDPLKDNDQIRNAYGVIPTFEFYPFDDLNLRFFLNYVGRFYEYSDYAVSRFGVKNYQTYRVSAGFVSPLGIF